MKNRFVFLIFFFFTQSVLFSQNLYDWQIEWVPWWEGNLGTFFASLALDSEDNPHITVVSGDEDPNQGYYHAYLVYGRKLGINWDLEKIDDGSGEHVYPSMCLDKYDIPHICDSECWSGLLKYTYWNGLNWDFEIIDPGNCDRPCHIAVDSMCQPHILYSNPSWLKYSVKIDTQWNIQTIDYGSFIHYSLCLDQFDCPHIAYVDCYVYDGLRYCFWDGNTWQYDTVATWPPYRPGNVSLCLDSSDNPHISFINGQGSPSGYLMHAYRLENNSWQIDTVDTNINGGVTFIAFDKTEYPHIAFYQHIGVGWYQLMFASKTPFGWFCEVVDTSRYHPFWHDNIVSLVFDSNNNPHIAYPGVRYALGTRIVGAEDKHKKPESNASLLSIHPNPFRTSISIEYELPSETQVSLKIYNSAGRVIRTLVDKRLQKGKCEVYWNRDYINGSKAPDGVYFCKFETDTYSETKKIIVLK